MPTDKKLNTLVLNVLTEEQYASATKNEDELYLTPDTPIEVNLYTHNISLSYNGQSYLYITLISSNNRAISSMIELIPLLDPTRYISCSGTLYNNQSFFPISCLYWQGSLSKSYIKYTDAVNGERSIIMTSVFGTSNTTVTDVVTSI